MRRAYEHLGRVEILQRASGQSDAETSLLVKFAQGELRAGHPEDAADLLRAAEHLSFAALGGGRGSGVSVELRREVEAEVDHLTRRAKDHAEEEGERHAEVAELCVAMLGRAQDELRKGVYRRALELARGAEALAHVFRHGGGRLGAGEQPLRLGAR